MRSRNDDLIFAIAAILVTLAYLASVSCISLPRSGAEPEWGPEMYGFEINEGKCQLGRGKHKIDCDEPQVFEFICIKTDELLAIKSKLQRCEAWR